MLLPLGIVGMFLLITYTIRRARHPVMCLAVLGLGSGVIMVMGIHFALSGTYSGPAFMASLVPSFLVSNLLLLNLFPDVDADQSIGRRHFPITIGCRASAHLYGIQG